MAMVQASHPAASRKNACLNLSAGMSNYEVAIIYVNHQYEREKKNEHTILLTLTE